MKIPRSIPVFSVIMGIMVGMDTTLTIGAFAGTMMGIALIGLSFLEKIIEILLKPPAP